MCQQKQELFHRYSEAMETLYLCLKMQTDAVLAGDPDFGRFDGAIAAAKLRKTDADVAYHAHLYDHACGGCPFHPAPVTRDGNTVSDPMAESAPVGRTACACL